MANANNQFVIKFNAAGVEPPSSEKKGFSLPPEGLYKARVVAMDTEPAKKAGRETEFNTKLTIALDDGGYTLERLTWIPEPVVRGKENDVAVKAAAFGQQTWVAFAMSKGVPKSKLNGELTITEEDILKGAVYVKIVHKESTNLKDDGTPFVNANLDGFVTKEAYLAEKGAGAGAATTTAKASARPAAASSLGSILGR